MAERILTLNGQIRATFVETITTKLSLAVLLHDDFAPGLLFSMTDSDLEDDLDDEDLSPELQQAFADKGFPISDDAEVAVVDTGNEWRITDASKIYLIREKNDKLYVYTPGGRPIGGVKVSLEENERQPIRNLSGYYLFTDLEEGDYTVQVTSDYYEQEEVTVPVSYPEDPKPEDFVVSIILKPVPSYPFPPGATLIKGVVKGRPRGEEDGELQPIADVRVRVFGEKQEDCTTQKGEFAIYFTWPPGGKFTERLTFTHSDYRRRQVRVEIEEGKTTSLSVTMRPKPD
jgi:hypothetical protein